MQRQPARGAQRALGPIDVSRRNNLLEFIGRSALVPLAHGRELRERIFALRRKIKRRVKDELAADQTARVIAR